MYRWKESIPWEFQAPHYFLVDPEVLAGDAG
jgi:hypothetical protein